MFRRFFRRAAPAGGIASAIYGAIVAQARTPALYADLGVPDTLEGRFEMFLLHTALVARRLGQGTDEDRQVGQEVFDRFCLEMDRSLREMGVGDLAVPKRMRRVGEAFYGRSAIYEAALADRNEAGLTEAVARMVFGRKPPDVAATALAHYIFAAADGLAATPLGELRHGRLPWPAPSAFVETDSTNERSSHSLTSG